jgi:arsenate reductase (glutaredoxin)
MNKLYGISNCDTVKKAKAWLTDRGIDFEFVDFRKQGLSASQVRNWTDAAGIDLILNKRGTTWRALSEDQKMITDQDQLVELMTQSPTLIKRPVLETSDRIEVGFKPDQYQSLFQ